MITNFNDYLRVLKYESLNSIQSYIEDHSIDYNSSNKYNLLYNIIFYNRFDILKQIIEEQYADPTIKINNKSLLDYAIEWSSDNNIKSFLSESGVQKSVDDKKSIFQKRIINKDDKNYEKYKKLFSDFYNKNSNYFNFKEIDGVKLENDKGDTYDILTFTVLGGSLDPNTNDDFNLDKVKILLYKKIGNPLEALKIMLQNIDGYNDVEKIKKFIKFIRSKIVEYKIDYKFVKKYTDNKEILGDLL